MDCLNTHLLARELDARWRGRRVAGVSFDTDARAIHCAVEGSSPLTFDLSAPDVEVRESSSGGEGPLLAGWRVVAVTAPVDERMIGIECEKLGKFRGSAIRRARLVLSVIPAARAAVLEDSSGHRLASLGSKLPSTAEPRPQPTGAEMAEAASKGDQAALLSARWMSPALADWLATEPDRAAARYEAICALDEPTPALCGAGLLPPWLCNGTELILPVQGDTAPEPEAREGDRDSDQWRQRALQRMRKELERAREAPRLRLIADALMAHGEGTPPAEVVLPDGNRATVEVRQGESAINIAERLYREVRSMERATESLPRRIAELERTPPAERPRRTGGVSRTRETRQATRAGRPYRLYRSSGGLEIWVGRGSASNEALTFRESSPVDVWLHARASAGAHVILRWHQDGAPPARDLEEAAMLAAWHSKARGSTVVPVDWTRRKYVRKPRGAAPGKVAVLQAQTIFVRPTQEVERRLRDVG